MLRTLLLPLLLLLCLPGTAGAQRRSPPGLELSEMAALLVFPIVTGGQAANFASTAGDVIVDTQRASTLVTITNGAPTHRMLLIDVVSGDVGEDAWKSNSYRCPLTGRETTTFVFSPAGPGNSLMHAECGALVVMDGTVVGVETSGAELRHTTRAQNGFMVVAVGQVQDQLPGTDVVLGSNDLFGDAIIVDPEGQTWSFPPLSFQAIGTNDGNKAYQFGIEYAAFPALLASQFLAEGPDNGVSAELILLTLDGKVGGSATPRVALAGNVYDDDEISQDWSYQFDCFDIVSLSEISGSFVFDPNGFNLRSPTGHFDLMTGATDAADDVHDAPFRYGDGDDFRNRGAHGWIVQSADGVVLGPDSPTGGAPGVATANRAGWARPLLQSQETMLPTGTDRPTFDATGAP